MLLLTLRGTPTLYNSDELGMTMAHIPPEKVLDPFEINVPGLGLGRDGARSPMPWNDRKHAGFSKCKPWCPLISDWETINVAKLERDPASMLSLHRKALRKEQPALVAGSYKLLFAEGDVLVYAREQEVASVLVALNLGPQPASLENEVFTGSVLLSTYCDRTHENAQGRVDLRPNEGLMILQ